jgi:hypothetical protein
MDKAMKKSFANASSVPNLIAQPIAPPPESGADTFSYSKDGEAA